MMLNWRTAGVSRLVSLTSRLTPAVAGDGTINLVFVITLPRPRCSGLGFTARSRSRL